MNKLINLEATTDITEELAAIGIGDQLVIDRGDYLFRHLSGMVTYTKQMIMGTMDKPHELVREVVEPAVKSVTLCGWELGKVNKTTTSVTQYNLVAFMLKNGQMLITRPRRTALSLRNGDLTKSYTYADEETRSTRGVGALAGTFTNDKTYPSAKIMHWNEPALQIPDNAERAFHILMTHTFNLAKNTSSTELTGMLDIAV